MDNNNGNNPMLTSQDFNTKKDLFSNTTQNNVTL